MARDKQMKPHAIHVHTNRVHAPLLTMNEWEESKSSKWTIEQVTTLSNSNHVPFKTANISNNYLFISKAYSGNNEI